jgi:hypothetical protein
LRIAAFASIAFGTMTSTRSLVMTVVARQFTSVT